MPTEIISLSVLYGFMFGCVYKAESVCWSQNNFMKWFALWHYIKGSAVRIGINWESQKKKKCIPLTFFVMSKTPFGKRVNTEPFRERTELRRTIIYLSWWLGMTEGSLSLKRNLKMTLSMVLLRYGISALFHWIL